MLKIDAFYFKLETNSSDSGVKSQIFNSKIPEKYFIVRNNEYVRVRYLLIYAEKSKTIKFIILFVFKSFSIFYKIIIFLLIEKVNWHSY